MKTSASQKRSKVVCLSAHLREGAAGHFYQYHKSLHNFLDNHFDVVYLGAEDPHQNPKQNWFSPILPKSLSMPSPRISNLRVKEFMNKAPRISTEPCLFYIYEGSIYWLTLAVKIIQKNRSAVFVVNQFNSRKTVDRLTGVNGIIWVGLYSWILREGNGRVFLAADNQKFYSKLTQLLPEGFIKYIPVVSSLPIKITSNENTPESLILIRGDYGKNALRSIAPYLKHSTHISVHGLDRITLNKMGLTLAKISTGGLNESDYTEEYRRYSRFVFLYDLSDFAYQSSGRFMDSHFAGLPILVPASTALAEEFPNCSLIARFNEDNYDSIVEFIRNENLTLEHSCDSLLIKVRDGFESVISESQYIKDEDLEFARIKPFLTFLLLNLMNTSSWLTKGGTLNLLALLDRLRKIAKSFREIN